MFKIKNIYTYIISLIWQMKIDVYFFSFKYNHYATLLETQWVINSLFLRTFVRFLEPSLEEDEVIIDEYMWTIVTILTIVNTFWMNLLTMIFFIDNQYFKPLFFKLNFLLNTLSKYIFISIQLFLTNFKWAFISLVVSISYFIISLFYIQIELTKQLTSWFLFFILFYWLISTFNVFINKYKYGKFTSAIQRFWKRTNIIFWLIEGFLFFLFFYYYLNSSQEPLYMFDFSNLNQELLISCKTTFKSLILLSILLYINYIILFNNNFLKHNYNFLFLLLPTLILTYILYIESYQFVYIISLFNEKVWMFDEQKLSWILETEKINLRVKQQYFILCLIAKYWHFIFIFISWFFFIIKSIENKKISYTLLGYNIQNLIILYILNLCCLIQWIKWLFKKFFDITYYWLQLQYDEQHIYIYLHEIKNIFFSLFNFEINLFTFYFNFNDFYIIYNIFLSNDLFFIK